MDPGVDELLNEKKASAPEAPAAGTPVHRARDSRGVLYPHVYVWYVFLASLDIMLTWIILHLEGVELNFVADRVIERWGLPGLTAFKFGLVMLVVCICEIVGRRRDRTGRKLAEWAVAVTTIPVVLSFVQLLIAAFR